LDRISRLAEEREDENLAFRAYLKMQDEDENELDERVHRILE